MIDFGLYCDIAESVKDTKNSDAVQFDKLFKKFTEDNKEEQAVYELINTCDMETLERLSSYFDRGALIQRPIKERMNKLRRINTENIEDYIAEELKEKIDFYPYLAQMIEKKGFASDSDFYNYIGMSRQTFAKLRRSGATVSRNHALLMTVGLKLSYKEAVEFMGMAGYAFKSTDMREAIISYVMRNKSYDLMEMEEILYSFGEKSLMDP